MEIDEHMPTEIVASAPGKVLITGGYLILERPNAGIVLSTTARFYAIVKPLYMDIKPESWAWAWTDVKVTSPQLHQEFEYKLSLKKSTIQTVSSRDPINPFVERSVQYAVAAAHVINTEKGREEALQQLLLHGLDITLLGSNDFYSYRSQMEACGLPLTSEALAAFPPFSSIVCNKDNSNGVIHQENWKPKIAKTGLGSSAAMTTAVVAALLHYLGAVNLPHNVKGQRMKNDANQDFDLIHMVAQAAHCIAQEKIGSGFDVSSAVYGSQRYVRFSHGVLYPLQVASKGLSLREIISRVLKGRWDQEMTHFSLPPLMTLLIGEPGTGGSSTLSMVGAVKQWQMSSPQMSQEMRRKLAEANLRLEVELYKLNSFAEERWEIYKLMIRKCSCHSHEKWMQQATDPSQTTIISSLLRTRDAILEIRSHMQLMGEAAGAPIEPESQTRHLDVTMAMEGVLFAAIPGAGGFDAIFAVVLGESSTRVTRAWSALGILPMLVREDPQGVCLESSDPRVNLISSGLMSIHVG